MKSAQENILRFSLLFDLCMLVRDPATNAYHLRIFPLSFKPELMEKVIKECLWKEGLEVKIIGAAKQNAFSLFKTAFVCEQIRLQKGVITLQDTGGHYGRKVEYDKVSHNLIINYYTPLFGKW